MEDPETLEGQVISSGQRLEIKNVGESYRKALGTVETGVKDLLFGGSLSNCEIDAIDTETYPSYFSFRNLICMGDDCAKGGPLTEISMLLSKVITGWQATIKTTVNSFGQVSSNEKVIQFSSCGIYFKEKYSKDLPLK